MPLVRKSISDVGIRIWAEVCEKCQHENWMYAADGYHRISAFGGFCGSCHTIVWCDNREHSFFKHYSKPPVSNGPQYVAWRDKLYKDFLNFLPDCPVCGKHEYTKTVNNCKAKYSNCEKCNSLLKHEKYTEITKDHQGELVYWLED